MPAAIVMPDVKIQLQREGFYPGQRVTGVVTVNVHRPVRLRGIRIRLIGVEHVQVHYGRQTRWIATPTIDQETVLVGRDRLPDAGAVVVDTWDTILQRAKHTRLLPGEYIHPFSIPLPSHAPPSYRGKIARVGYKLQLTVDRPMRKARVQHVPLWVSPPGRQGTAVPLSLSTSGEDQPLEEPRARSPRAQFSIHLDRQEFVSGKTIPGEYLVENPAGEMLEGLVISLRSREETYAHGGSGSEQGDVVRLRLPFKDIGARMQKGKFCVQIPKDTPPSISGRTFALTYSLEIRLAAPRSSDLTLQTEISITPPPAQA